jgi:hypothetical protein
MTYEIDCEQMLILLSQEFPQSVNLTRTATEDGLLAFLQMSAYLDKGVLNRTCHVFGLAQGGDIAKPHYTYVVHSEASPSSSDYQ